MSRGGRFARDSADNEEGRREDRFLNLIRGWREKLSGREHTDARAHVCVYGGGRTKTDDSIVFERAVRRRNDTGRWGEAWKRRECEKERRIAVRLFGRERRRDRLYAPFHSSGPVFVQVPRRERCGPRGILQGPVSASLRAGSHSPLSFTGPSSPPS